MALNTTISSSQPDFFSWPIFLRKVDKISLFFFWRFDPVHRSHKQNPHSKHVEQIFFTWKNTYLNTLTVNCKVARCRWRKSSKVFGAANMFIYLSFYDSHSHSIAKFCNPIRKSSQVESSWLQRKEKTNEQTNSWIIALQVAYVTKTSNCKQKRLSKMAQQIAFKEKNCSFSWRASE